MAEGNRTGSGGAAELSGDRAMVLPGPPRSVGQSGQAEQPTGAGARVGVRPAPVRGMVGLVGVVFGALGVAVLAMVLLHLLGAGRLDPLTNTVSDYVSIPGGTALLTLSVLGLATATAAVAVAARGVGAHRPALLFGFGCAGLLATIAFPTNALGTPATVDTVLHRYVAAAFFVSLPIAAVLVLRRHPDRVAHGITVASVLTGAAFLVSHIPLLFPNWPGAPEVAAVLPRGLAERALLVVDTALLARLAGRVSP